LLTNISLADTIEKRQLNRMTLQAVAIISVVFLLAYIDSLLGSGLIILGVTVFLIFIFLNNYKLAIMCAVLSFSYQSPVWKMPALGLSAEMRMDEMFCGCLSAVFILKLINKSIKINNDWPLILPLKIYVLAAIGSTLIFSPWLTTTSYWLARGYGLKGLLVISLKLTTCVCLYFAIASGKQTLNFRKQLIYCLIITVCISTIIAAGLSQAILNTLYRTAYDPHLWVGRFGGIQQNYNTCGSFSMQSLWIILASLALIPNPRFLIIIFPIIIANGYIMILSGSRGAWVSFIAGIFIVMILLILRSSKKVVSYLMLITVASIIMILAYVNFSTEEQQKAIQNRVVSATDFVGFGAKSWDWEQEGSRQNNIIRLGTAIWEKPQLFFLGNGWQRRGTNRKINALHSDLLTLTADLGIIGAIIFFLIYFRLFKAYNPLAPNLLKSNVPVYFMLTGATISFFIYSFSNELFTLYPTIDTTFSWFLVFFAVIGGMIHYQQKEVSNNY